MSVAVVRGVLSVWHFQYPECGMGDEELGQLAQADDILLRSMHDRVPAPSPTPPLARPSGAVAGRRRGPSGPHARRLSPAVSGYSEDSSSLRWSRTLRSSWFSGSGS